MSNKDERILIKKISINNISTQDNWGAVLATQTKLSGVSSDIQKKDLHLGDHLLIEKGDDLYLMKVQAIQGFNAIASSEDAAASLHLRNLGPTTTDPKTGVIVPVWYATKVQTYHRSSLIF